MASISTSSDQRLSTSKRRLKPLMLRDYLLDDLSSCSSNGFNSFPRRQTPSSSSTVRRLLDAEIKRSGLIHHHKPRRFSRRNRTTCATAITHVVHKASTAFLNAVKLLPFPSSTVKSPSGDHYNHNNNKQGVFSRSVSKRLLSRAFWRKPVSQSRREVTGDVDGDIQWWRSAAYFSDEESLDHQPSDLISQISTTVEEPTFSSISPATTTKVVKFISGESSSSSSEFFTNSSEIVQSSSSFSSTTSDESEEVSNENDGVEDGEKLNAHDCDGSSVNRNSLCNRKECVNEETEQLSPVSILECRFEDEENDEDDASNYLISHQNDTYEKIARKSRRLNGLVRLEPLDLEKHTENYVERQEYSYHTLETKEDESKNRATLLFALVKSKIGETNNILASKVADNLLIDYLQEEDNIGAKEETLMVKKVEEWVMGRQEEMFMSWEVREKREVYVKEMKWGYINEDDRDYVVEDLANGFFTSLVDEFVFDIASC